MTLRPGRGCEWMKVHAAACSLGTSQSGTRRIFANYGGLCSLGFRRTDSEIVYSGVFSEIMRYSAALPFQKTFIRTFWFFLIFFIYQHSTQHRFDTISWQCWVSAVG